MPKIIDSLYLHFPFCAHLCNYCDFYKKVSQNKELEVGIYQQSLEESYKQHENLIKEYGYSWQPLKTFYIGGGTPSLWGKSGKIFLENFFKKCNISFSKNIEFTLEVNPGAWSEETLNSWKEFGVNRYSLGVQSLNPQMIKYLDRIHSIEDVHDTLKYFSENKLNFSVDLMLGLPFSRENNRHVIEELEVAISYNPSHFSVYILTVKDNYTHFSNLPDEEWIEKEYMDVANYLKQKGFIHYEVSNFAKPNKESIHNLNYWKNKTVAALGPSATGYLSNDKIRYKWKTNKPECEIEILTEQEAKLEAVYMNLRSFEGLKFSDYDIKLQEIALKWQESELAEVFKEKVVLTSEGFLLLDSLIDDLFKNKII